MNSWKFYLLVCSLIFTAGFITGQICSFKGDFLDQISKAVDVLSSLVTIFGVLIFGVLIAYWSFNSWKSQYKNTKLDNLIDKLEDAWETLYQSIHSYRHNILMLEKQLNNAGASETYETLKGRELSSKQEHFEKRRIYSTSYRKLQRHLECSSIISITPDFVHGKSTVIFQHSHSTYNSSDLFVSDSQLSQDELFLEEFWNDTKNGFQELRTKVLLTS